VEQYELLKRFPQHVETSSGGVGGAMREYVVRGSDLVLGAEQIQHPVTAMADVSKGKLAQSDLSGIVGIGALKRYVVTFDFPGKRLFLKRYEPAPADLDTYDRSGMRIERETAGFRIISVSSGTPAAEAGLHLGDVIVAVDGRPASSITLPTLRDEFRQRRPGSVIALGIQSEGERRCVRMVLRDLL
jgi:membrane-associated protease RseP (regulator of RpoE activity)